ncbi:MULTISPECIES: hypothetical protein [Vibrio]|uniref:Uncharacterized protein n=1 Tax=Vibrio parahaemolyticus TaxID=670 RepID=A0AAW3IWC9_VIBPH|nr:MULTISPECIES: hypothetical protein [Vibrio]EGR3355920.1 hypothetical protein [Vibrio parahaemolyticus]EIV8661239.1 hypothetical protein [Vibrio parahaemolyticus]EJG1852733.1 hypothetical protein [Vibrio parahaemolyticus]KOY28427.1 hypothetical protein ACX05_18725 [Vibrio parahaemolyticus]MCR9307860.1 hypothetical protein [Vibrio diabolicus]
MNELKPRNREMSTGLLRQRRNLLASSAVMPMFFVSQATVEKINVLGTVINIGSPSSINYMIGTVFVYFLLRYWQYYREENHLRDSKRSATEHMYAYEESHRYALARAQLGENNSSAVSIYMLDPNIRRSFSYGGIKDKPNERVSLFKTRGYFYAYTENSSDQKLRKKFHTHMQSDPYLSWERLHPHLDGTTDVENQFYKNHYEFVHAKFYFTRVFGWLKYAFSTSYFTDYHMPFLVAFVAVVTSAVGVFI